MPKVEVDTDELGMSVEQIRDTLQDGQNNDVTFVITSVKKEQDELAATEVKGGNTTAETAQDYSSEYAPLGDHLPTKGSYVCEVLLSLKGNDYMTSSDISKGIGVSSNKVSMALNNYSDILDIKRATTSNGGVNLYRLNDKGVNLATFIQDFGRAPYRYRTDSLTKEVAMILYNAGKAIPASAVKEVKGYSISSLRGMENNGCVEKVDDDDPSTRSWYLYRLTEWGKESLKIEMSS